MIDVAYSLTNSDAMKLLIELDIPYHSHLVDEGQETTVEEVKELLRT